MKRRKVDWVDVIVSVTVLLLTIGVLGFAFQQQMNNIVP